MIRKFNIKPGAPYKPCPKCGNRRHFAAHSERCAEDYCNIWVSCDNCGYDPFHDYDNIEGCTFHCIEDVMGGINIGTLSMALDEWNELIDLLNKEPDKQ